MDLNRNDTLNDTRNSFNMNITNLGTWKSIAESALTLPFELKLGS